MLLLGLQERDHVPFRVGKSRQISRSVFGSPAPEPFRREPRFYRGRPGGPLPAHRQSRNSVARGRVKLCARRSLRRRIDVAQYPTRTACHKTPASWRDHGSRSRNALPGCSSSFSHTYQLTSRQLLTIARLAALFVAPSIRLLADRWIPAAAAQSNSQTPK